MKLKNKVYEIVSKIPSGHVTTYGDIGRKIGTKGYRAIGQILHTNPTWPEVPCHRVVMKDGSVASNYGGGGPNIHQILHTNPTWPQVPCHRVVMKDGSVASNYGGGGPNIHKKRLMDEGVQFIGDKVNLEKHKIIIN